MILVLLFTSRCCKNSWSVLPIQIICQHTCLYMWQCPSANQLSLFHHSFQNVVTLFPQAPYNNSTSVLLHQAMLYLQLSSPCYCYLLLNHILFSSLISANHLPAGTASKATMLLPSVQYTYILHTHLSPTYSQLTTLTC